LITIPQISLNVSQPQQQQQFSSGHFLVTVLDVSNDVVIVSAIDSILEVRSAIPLRPGMSFYVRPEEGQDGAIRWQIVNETAAEPGLRPEAEKTVDLLTALRLSDLPVTESDAARITTILTRLGSSTLGDLLAAADIMKLGINSELLEQAVRSFINSALQELTRTQTQSREPTAEDPGQASSPASSPQNNQEFQKTGTAPVQTAKGTTNSVGLVQDHPAGETAHLATGMITPLEQLLAQSDPLLQQLTTALLQQGPESANLLQQLQLLLSSDKAPLEQLLAQFTQHSGELGQQLLGGELHNWVQWTQNRPCYYLPLFLFLKQGNLHHSELLIYPPGPDGKETAGQHIWSLTLTLETDLLGWMRFEAFWSPHQIRVQTIVERTATKQLWDHCWPVLADRLSCLHLQLEWSACQVGTVQSPLRELQATSKRFADYQPINVLA
jgi:hypothetical protein